MSQILKVNWAEGRRAYEDLGDDFEPAEYVTNGFEVMIQPGQTESGLPVICIRGKTNKGTDVVFQITARNFVTVAHIVTGGDVQEETVQ